MLLKKKLTLQTYLLYSKTSKKLLNNLKKFQLEIFFNNISFYQKILLYTLLKLFFLYKNYTWFIKKNISSKSELQLYKLNFYFKNINQIYYFLNKTNNFNYSIFKFKYKIINKNKQKFILLKYNKLFTLFQNTSYFKYNNFLFYLNKLGKVYCFIIFEKTTKFDLINFFKINKIKIK